MKPGVGVAGLIGKRVGVGKVELGGELVAVPVAARVGPVGVAVAVGVGPVGVKVGVNARVGVGVGRTRNALARQFESTSISILTGVGKGGILSG